VVTLNLAPSRHRNDFGNWTPPRRKARSSKDLDADGVKDEGEPGLANWRIYADLNDNSAFDIGEPSAVTDANGNYSIGGLTPGSYTSAKC